MASGDDALSIPSELAGSWTADTATALGFRCSDPSKGLCCSVSKFADRPWFSLLQAAAGKACPSLPAFDLLREKKVHFIIDKDLSKITLLLDEEQKEEWLFDGNEHSIVSILCPLGLSSFKAISCSRSKLSFQLTLPQKLAVLHGSLELTSETTSVLTAEAETLEGHCMVSVKLRRSQSRSLQKSAPARWRSNLSRPSMGTVQEDALLTGI
eukprot:TRINITY_DN11477_c0_g1_i1.p1 TRINITY_DN11477_c0_g1~~TRINITY_DN11477_c0_g1_i1.p1  ORF type:complete len:211 (-),score=35.17 TRINITY_DN11477_c0_g1_i1:48-680(-)